MGLFEHRASFGLVAIFAAALLACGRTEHDEPNAAGTAAGGAAASGGEAAGVTTASGGAGTVPNASGGTSCGVGFAPPGDGVTDLVELSDTSDCTSRPSVDCDANSLRSDLRTLASPVFSACEKLMPYDGCGRMLLDFDENGCMKSTTTLSDVDGKLRDHFVELRACLKTVLDRARWSCLPAARLEYCESCRVR